MKNATNHRDRKSAGHICFAGDFEFYKQADGDGEMQIFRANRSSAFDLSGCRHGRWECAATHLDTYGFETVTGLKPDPIFPGYCDACGEAITSVDAHAPDCWAWRATAETELYDLAEGLRSVGSLVEGEELKLHDHGNEQPAKRFAVYTQGGYSAGCVAVAATASLAVAAARKELRWPR